MKLTGVMGRNGHAAPHHSHGDRSMLHSVSVPVSIILPFNINVF